eukprot:RCo014864
MDSLKTGSICSTNRCSCYFDPRNGTLPASHSSHSYRYGSPIGAVGARLSTLQHPPCGSPAHSCVVPSDISVCELLVQQHFAALTCHSHVRSRATHKSTFYRVPVSTRCSPSPSSSAHGRPPGEQLSLPTRGQC